MKNGWIAAVEDNYLPDRSEPVLDSLFHQYERVLVESLIASFGMDFLIVDRHGGDVDTIHNVRQIGKDGLMAYKNKDNEKAYVDNGSYDSFIYHHDAGYIETNRSVSSKRKAGELQDAYTMEPIARNGKTDLDHVISAKEIHDDRGRVLAGLKGTELANSKDNLRPTNPHTNRTKQAFTMEEFLARKGHEYTEAQQKNMRQVDEKARAAYEAKLATAYYIGPRFAKDMTLAAANVSVEMGMRQTLGFVFAEMWFAVKEEFQRISRPMDMSRFLDAVGRGIKRGVENAKKKYRILFSRFLSGSMAGGLASLTTTLANIFFTTAKDAVRLIRNCYVSLVDALKILLINPSGYLFGDRMRAVAKVLATGASVAMGITVSEAVSKTHLSALPVLGEIIQSFCGTFVTGILSCTLLFYMDSSNEINHLVRLLNELHTIDTDVKYYQQQAEQFEQYAAQLMRVDYRTFRKQVSSCETIADKLALAVSGGAYRAALEEAIAVMKIDVPWEGDFDSFMDKQSSRLVFR